MKKIELNSGLKFVLIILTWLLTFTVTNVSGLISGAGSFIGMLAIYAGVLFLDFAYFKDECLQKHAKMSLLIVAIILIAQLLFSCIGYTFDLIISFGPGAKVVDALNKTENVLDYLFQVCKVVVVAVALIKVILKTKDCCANTECTCEAKAEVIEETKDAE